MDIKLNSKDDGHREPDTPPKKPDSEDNTDPGQPAPEGNTRLKFYIYKKNIDHFINRQQNDFVPNPFFDKYRKVAF